MPALFRPIRQYLLILFLFLVNCDVFAISEDPIETGGWVNRDGTPVPDRDNVKGKKGFGGWVIVTPDEDWAEKWDTPAENTPHFNEASNVNYGDSLTILIFVINPAADTNGEVNVSCDIQVVRPDNSFSIDETGIECMKGGLQGNPRSIRLTAPIIKFGGETGDLPGHWIVKINLIDKNRGVFIPLKTGFTLIQ